jgi:hypothetical protein
VKIGDAFRAFQLASDLVTVAKEIPDAVEQVRAWVDGGAAVPTAVLDALPDLSRNHVEQARIDRLARS